MEDFKKVIITIIGFVIFGLDVLCAGFTLFITWLPMSFIVNSILKITEITLVQSIFIMFGFYIFKLKTIIQNEEQTIKKLIENLKSNVLTYLTIILIVYVIQMLIN
jgi:hypothetical protein